MIVFKLVAWLALLCSGWHYVKILRRNYQDQMLYPNDTIFATFILAPTFVSCVFYLCVYHGRFGGYVGGIMTGAGICLLSCAIYSLSWYIRPQRKAWFTQHVEYVICAGIGPCIGFSLGPILIAFGLTPLF